MAFSGVTGSAKEDLVVSLAILALHDGGVAVSADNINAIVSASGNTVAGYWGALYSKVLAGRNIDDLLLKPGAGGAPAPAAAGGAAASAGGDAGKKEEKKEEKKEGEFVFSSFKKHLINSRCLCVRLMVLCWHR